METKTTAELTPSSKLIYDCVWEWDLFGHREMVVVLTYNTPFWRRTLTRILLGSKWKKL